MPNVKNKIQYSKKENRKNIYPDISKYENETKEIYLTPLIS